MANMQAPAHASGRAPHGILQRPQKRLPPESATVQDILPRQQKRFYLSICTDFLWTCCQAHRLPEASAPQQAQGLPVWIQSMDTISLVKFMRPGGLSAPHKLFPLCFKLLQTVHNKVASAEWITMCESWLARLVSRLSPTSSSGAFAEHMHSISTVSIVLCNLYVVQLLQWHPAMSPLYQRGFKCHLSFHAMFSLSKLSRRFLMHTCLLESSATSTASCVQCENPIPQSQAEKP